MNRQALKIAVLSDAVFPFNKGGKEIRIFNLTTQLVRQGHDVHIFTMKWWDGPSKTWQSDGVTFHAICRRYELYAGNRRSISEGLLFALASFRLLRHDFDLLEVDHMPFFPLFPAKLIALIKRRPLFATWHEVWGPSYWKTYLGPAGYIAALVERASVRVPDHIIAVSQQTHDQLRTKLNVRGPITIIPNGIDLTAITSSEPAAQTSDCMYAGRLLPHKHVDVLIEAVALVVKTHPDFVCLILGDGPEKARLERLVDTLKLRRHVIFTGFVATNNEVYAAMKSSRVFVLPSAREGFGVTVVEAIAAGLKVLTSNHPENAARHLITPDNGLVSDITPVDLARNLIKLLEQPSRPKTSSIDQFTWPAAATKLNQVYQS